MLVSFQADYAHLVYNIPSIPGCSCNANTSFRQILAKLWYLDGEMSYRNTQSALLTMPFTCGLCRLRRLCKWQCALSTSISRAAMPRALAAADAAAVERACGARHVPAWRARRQESSHPTQVSYMPCNPAIQCMHCASPSLFGQADN